MSAGARGSLRHALALAGLLLVAGWLRLSGLDWDQGQHLNPDERFLTMVAADARMPASVGEYFDTGRSPLNPANSGRRFFTYGTFPLTLVRAIAEAARRADYGRIHLVGRATSAAADLGTVALTCGIALLLYGRAASLIAAALMAFSVISIQHAHFFTVDSLATLFSTAAVGTLGVVALGGRLRWHALFGVSLGLALACRINVVVLAALYPLAAVQAWRGGSVRARRLVVAAALAGATTLLVFRVFQPYAFAGPGFFTGSLAKDFVDTMVEIRATTTGAADFPPGVQWIGRLPLVHPGWNLLVWNLGPAWGVAALLGVIWGLLRRSDAAGDRRVAAARVVLLWAPLLFVFQGIQFVHTGRYFLPLVPVLAVAAGGWLGARGRRRAAWRAAAALVVALTALWALAFTSIYRRPHVRVEASRWIFEQLAPGTAIATEHWDDALPLALPGRSRDGYEGVQLTLYDEENERKRQQLIAALDGADVIVLSSNRLYRSIPRVPWRYPLGRRYYELLFAGELGFRLERVFTSYPRLGPLEIRDDEAEEAFTVYDHPKVLVFRKASYSHERVASLLGSVSLSNVVRVPPREASRLYRRFRPSDVRLAGEEAVRSAVAVSGTGSLTALARWLAVFELLSLAIFVLAFRLLAGARDRGYGLAKLLAWLAPGALVWLLVTAGLAPNSAATARAVAAAVVAAGAMAAWRRRRELASFLADARVRRPLLAVEAVFLGVFVLFLAARAFNPAIFWGEKPMDYAILNACLRSPTLPPADPWFAGEPLNYSYFGHALCALFSRLSGVPPAFAFNLAIPTLAGMLAAAGFLFGHQLTGRLAPGFAAAGLLTLVGNLAGARRLVIEGARHLDFDYFWATSRVVAGTINEFPFWSLLFADLHAHVLSMPLEVALLYVGALWLAPAGGAPGVPRPVVGALAALLLGAAAVTSPWSAPLAAAVQLGFLATASRRCAGRWRGLALALATWIAAVLAAVVLFWPFWARYLPPPRNWGWSRSDPAGVGDMVTIFGVFLAIVLAAIAGMLGPGMLRRPPWSRRGVFLAAAVALAAGVGGWRSPSCGLFAALALVALALWLLHESEPVRAGALLVASASAVVALSECVFVWDRMNTVFKFQLQAWLLFASGAPLLAWAALRQATGWRRAAITAVAVLAVAGGALTSASDLIAALANPRAPSPSPTLDGMAYLGRQPSSERAAIDWINREVAGIPVLLEAQGASYQAFSRVSMNTGLPTVLGWEYHLVQQSRPPEQIAARASDVRELYETPDLQRAEQLLRRYHVDLVFVGPLERRTYGAAGLAKFARWSAVEPVFRDAHVTVYATPARRAGVKTWIEKVPPAPTGFALREPRGIAAAPDGTFFVADFGNRRIEQLAADARPLGAFGHEGDGPGEFRDPCGVAVGRDATIWVADTWNHRIQHLTRDGQPLGEWRAELYGPRGIALASEGLVYVTDTGHHRVVRFTAEGKADVLVSGGVLDNPVGIALGGDGLLYVADAGHRRIAVFTRDGAFRRAWPVEGWTPGPFLEPYLAVGRDGVVWATDPRNRRVLLFDPEGRPLGSALAPLPLELPLGIALADDDSALVMDAAKGRAVRVRRAPDQRGPGVATAGTGAATGAAPAGTGAVRRVQRPTRKSLAR